MQALQRPVRGAGRRGHAAPRLRPVPGQPGASARTASASTASWASPGRRSRSRCSSPTSAGRRGSASGSARPGSTTSSCTSTGSGRRRSSTTAASSTSSSATRSSGCSSAGSAGRGMPPRRSRPRPTSWPRRAGRRDAEGPIPIGAGVHTGIAFVGPTGPEGLVDDFTALGDPSTRRPGWRPRRRPASCSSAWTRPRRRARAASGADGGRSRCEGGRRRSTSWSSARRPDGRSLRSRPSTPALEQDDVAPATGRVLAQPMLDADPDEADPLVRAPGSRRCRP